MILNRCQSRDKARVPIESRVGDEANRTHRVAFVIVGGLHKREKKKEEAKMKDTSTTVCASVGATVAEAEEVNMQYYQ